MIKLQSRMNDCTYPALKEYRLAWDNGVMQIPGSLSGEIFYEDAKKLLVFHKDKMSEEDFIKGNQLLKHVRDEWRDLYSK